MKSSFLFSRIKSAIAPTTKFTNNFPEADFTLKWLYSLEDIYPFTQEEIYFLHVQTGGDYSITEKLLTYATKNRLTAEEAVELHQYLNYSV